MTDPQPPRPVRGIAHPKRFLRRWRFPWHTEIGFWLIAWRCDGEPVRTDWHVAFCKVPFGTGWWYQRHLAAQPVLEFAGLAFGDAGTGTPAVAVRVTDEDPALRAAAVAVLEGDQRKTAEFGTFVRAPGEEQYVVACDWHGAPIELLLTGTRQGQPGSVLPEARRLHADWPRWRALLRARMESELLPLWHDWNADALPIDVDTLLGRLRLTSICLMGDNLVELWFEAGDQFGEHDVAVWGHVVDGPIDINI